MRQRRSLFGSALKPHSRGLSSGQGSGQPDTAGGVATASDKSVRRNSQCSEQSCEQAGFPPSRDQLVCDPAGHQDRSGGRLSLRSVANRTLRCEVDPQRMPARTLQRTLRDPVAVRGRTKEQPRQVFHHRQHSLKPILDQCSQFGNILLASSLSAMYIAGHSKEHAQRLLGSAPGH